MYLYSPIIVDVFRKYHIEFGAETDPEANWEFVPV